MKPALLALLLTPLAGCLQVDRLQVPQLSIQDASGLGDVPFSEAPDVTPEESSDEPEEEGWSEDGSEVVENPDGGFHPDADTSEDIPQSDLPTSCPQGCEDTEPDVDPTEGVSSEDISEVETEEPECLHDSECEDGSPCTLDHCTSGECVVALGSGEACDDGNPCTDLDVCLKGLCAGTTADCDDGVACTLDSCNAETGECVHGDESCECLSDADCGSLTDQCNIGACDTSVGACYKEPKSFGTGCDDGNACTQISTCSNGICKGTQPLNCDDGDPCNGTETCSPIMGCMDGTLLPTCQQDEYCETFEGCVPKCEEGEVWTPHLVSSGYGECFLACDLPEDCADGDPCTTDACNSKSDLPAKYCTNFPKSSCP